MTSGRIPAIVAGGLCAVAAAAAASRLVFQANALTKVSWSADLSVATLVALIAACSFRGASAGRAWLVAAAALFIAMSFATFAVTDPFLWPPILAILILLLAAAALRPRNAASGRPVRPVIVAALGLSAALLIPATMRNVAWSETKDANGRVVSSYAHLSGETCVISSSSGPGESGTGGCESVPVQPWAGISLLLAIGALAVTIRRASPAPSSPAETAVD